ncbi:MAG: SUF system NifU family Fe-S cluster assembly protein [Candidatus Aenigmarchaeota archaeon]|nr:SUF system NifU family Fe-S cluster assembly protein [Candidatus Aenigmarchaeota archaeon]
MSLEIYHETILAHYNNPGNSGVISDADVISKDNNPVCGDVVEIQVKFNGERIDEIKFQGQGCAISLASVDILIDAIKGKTVDQIKNFRQEDFLKLLGIEISPLRLKCALLGLKVLKTGVYSYLDNNTEST